MPLLLRALAITRACLFGLALLLVLTPMLEAQDAGHGTRFARSAAGRSSGATRRSGAATTRRAGARRAATGTRTAHTRRAATTHRAARRSASTRSTVRRRGAPHVEPGAGSVSVGRPNRGRLVRGVALEPSEHLVVKSSSQGQNYGTSELVSLLGRVASRVAEQSPGGRLHVGDLSREAGGRFGPHRSHRSGRDADVGLYLVDAAEQPIVTERFYDIRRDGTARQDPTVRLDESRTWELLEALVSDTQTPVQFVFLAAHIEQRLLAEGRQRGASEELLARVDAVVDAERQHTNHMHIRIYCPVDDVPRCDEEPPYHPWVDRTAAREAAAVAQAEEARRQQEAARASRRRRTRAGRVARAGGASSVSARGAAGAR